MFGDKFVWIHYHENLGVYAEIDNYEDSPCSVDEIVLAAEGSFVFRLAAYETNYSQPIELLDQVDWPP